jgi:NDP-sugar pyrophosphorylase family protein
MQVAILAGGKGTRLMPMTHTIPKPMVKVAGRPFLEHLLELFKKQKFSRILMLVSHLGQQIEDYFKNGSRFGLDIIYSYEKTPMGTGGALINARDLLEDNFILLNGDTLLPINYNDLVEYYKSINKTGVIVAYDNHQKLAPSNLKVSLAGSVLKYSKDSETEMTHIDAGAVVFNKKILEFIPKNTVCSLEKEIFPKLIAADEFYAFITDKKFYDMGSFEGISRIEQVLK